MGIFDFVKDAGAAIFGGKSKGTAEVVRTPDMAKADRAKGEALASMVKTMDLDVDELKVGFLDGTATMHGSAPSQAVREKVVLLVGNTQGVAKVDDRMQVEKPEPEAKMHTVVSGDTLGKIAKTYYGDAMKYPKIFEANKPMLKDPDKIYPGQVLRIPSLD